MEAKLRTRDEDAGISSNCRNAYWLDALVSRGRHPLAAGRWADLSCHPVHIDRHQADESPPRPARSRFGTFRDTRIARALGTLACGQERAQPRGVSCLLTCDER